MGIDAQMFSRYHGERPTQDQLKLWSWDLCRVIGARHFFIDAEKGQAALELSHGYDDNAVAGKSYGQDGPDIIAEDGEWFVEVSLCTRYYGPGYERGSWETIVHTAEWLERFIGPVWYGGDLSGVCATLFDRVARDAMVSHALSLDGRNYFSNFEREAFKTPSPCALCVKDRGMIRHGWGAGYIAVACGGCGRSFETRNDGKTWTVTVPPA
jgi:hypothetical protein